MLKTESKTIERLARWLQLEAVAEAVLETERLRREVERLKARGSDKERRS